MSTSTPDAGFDTARQIVDEAARAVSNVCDTYVGCPPTGTIFTPHLPADIPAAQPLAATGSDIVASWIQFGAWAVLAVGVGVGAITLYERWRNARKQRP